MSAPQDSTAATGKVDQKPTETPKEVPKATAALEEDDEFEDFPVEGELHSDAILGLNAGILQANESPWVFRLATRRRRNPWRKYTFVGGELGR